MRILLVLLFSGVFIGMIPVFAEPIAFDLDSDTLIPGEIVEISGTVDPDLADKPVAIEIRDSAGNTILIRTIQPNPDGTFSLKFKVPASAAAGEFDITANTKFEGAAVTESKTIEGGEAKPKEPVCGTGTHEEDGVCVADAPTGGGCLIATATFGSELAPEVQKLREIRDNTLLQTESGTSFMQGFNSFYYSFSPTIADYERQNPMFKEAVKLAITPLITSLSILNYVEIDSEAEMLSYGISLIILNVGMYFVAPAVLIQSVSQLWKKKN